MTIEEQLFAALGPLVEGRATPNTFPQHQPWPAIRFQIVSVVTDLDSCGDGGDETAQIRAQIDYVAKSYDDARAGRAAVMAAMRLFEDPPAVLEGSFDDYDPEAKGHRCSLDYVLQPSSEPDA